MRLARIAVAVLAVGAVAAFIGVGLPEGAQGLSNEPTHGIAVHGTGKASTVPDTATFTFGVNTKRKSAADASDANNRQMDEVIAALKASGVAEKDIQTSQISLYPNYDESSSEPDGYQATSSGTVTVKMRSPPSPPRNWPGPPESGTSA